MNKTNSENTPRIYSNGIFQPKDAIDPKKYFYYQPIIGIKK
jgi:hypothetical protein